MRIGINPRKDDKLAKAYGLHRLIMPVYIPNQDGYFVDSLNILRLCLESLRLTKKPETAITLVANGCGEHALSVLQEEWRRGWIDQLVINHENRGKVDAIVGVARGSFESVVTFADSDALFRPGWDTAIEKLFSLFPECGFVCPLPIPDTECTFTSAALLAGACARSLAFEQVADPGEVATFHKSIGGPAEKLALLQLGQLVISRKGETACIGGGHFVCSLRREVFKAMPQTPTLLAMGNKSEARWFDASPDRLGYWKLSTTKAYVQHMGNRWEPYMSQEIAQLRLQPPVPSLERVQLSPMRRHWTALIPGAIRVRVGIRLGRWLRIRGRKRAVQAGVPRGNLRRVQGS